MKIALVSLLALGLACLSVCQVPGKVRFSTPVPGAGWTNTVTLRYKVGDDDSSLVTSIRRSVVDATDGGVAFSAEFESFSMTRGTTDTSDVEITPCTWLLTKTSDLTGLDGGVEAIDTVRLLAATTFLTPTSDLGVGEKFLVDFTAPRNDDLRRWKVDETYQGVETVGDQSAFKFSVKYSEVGDSSFGYEGTVWVTQSSEVLKADYKFTNLYVPSLSLATNGTLTLTSGAAN